MRLGIITYRGICSVIVLLIFAFSVFIDMYNGYCQHYLNKIPLLPSLYKGGVLFVCLSCSFIGKWKPFFKGLLLCLFLYVVSFLYWCIFEPYFSLKDEFGFFIKFSFPYIVLAFLFLCEKHISTSRLIRLLTYYGIIGAVSIIVLFFLGLGVNSYGEVDSAYGFGTKGFFTAGNDIGLVLLLTNNLLCYLYLSRNKLHYLFEIVLVTIGTIMLGTMAGIGGSILIWGILFGFILFSKKFLSKRQKLFLALIIGGILGYIIYNIIAILTADDYMVQRFHTLLSGDSRTGLEVPAKHIMSKFNVAQWLLGRGYTGFGKSMALERNLEGYRLTEMDFYDVIGYYGVILGGIVLLFSFYILFIICRSYLKKHSSIYFWGIIFMCLFIGHGCLAGHAYTSTQASLLFTGFVFCIWRKYHTNKFEAIKK